MFTLSMPATNRKLNLTDPAPEPISLTTKHRPERFPDIVGQSSVVEDLETFCGFPYSAAFIFSGPTGIGKTTAALALARELGAVEYGGLQVVKSGTQDAEMVTKVLDATRFTPMLGSGWHVIIVDEADYMSPKAAQIWLSALEDLNPRTIVVFTTNHVAKMQDRFFDRCEHFVFDSCAAVHAVDAQQLIDRVWFAEVGDRRSIPRLADLKGVVDEDGDLSYRRVIRALEPLLRAEARKATPAPALAPTASQRPSRRVELPTGSSYRMSFA